MSGNISPRVDPARGILKGYERICDCGLTDAELRVLREDSKRLDWCQNNGTVTWTPHNDDPNWTVEWPDEYSATGNSADGPTLRAAIDAARAVAAAEGKAPEVTPPSPRTTE